ncbi:VOC family protein [Lichenifustis flavocetrariae]|uniref:VOC family protein n=1 Tax=Lichenifustis flavocetrariae TaxID=2949735 RepID=A0AA41YYU5_9HYPH|nr:VOC family protein [Lichenifustis flavocetrariae]MCW6507388.1 VOC family protein [Lichenifustis flavocetrariae]
MLSHVFIGIADFVQAKAFYAAVMAELGFALKFEDPERQWAGWMQPGVPRPLFLVGVPFDGRPAQPGNGQMVALLAPDRGAVNRCHAAALALGAADEGGPGLRPQYHPDYYGAYFRDPDGNKLCVCCHDPVSSSSDESLRAQDVVERAP